MSMVIDTRQVPHQAMGVRIVKPLQFDDHTPQTTGMRRLAAISHLLVGSESLWAGVMLAEPHTTSPVHHHGSLETIVYVLSGTSKIRWGSRLEHDVDLEPGDFLLIPPYTPHQEINPSLDQPTIWIVVRSGQETVIEQLFKNNNGEYVAIVEDESKRLVSTTHEGENHHVQAN